MRAKELKNSYKAIDESLKQLKDFQKKTVDYTYQQLYQNNRNKILVADEVGLGKTIVAKGIIARGFKKYLEDGGPNKENPTYNVVYICSNLAIAKQNISKLNIFNYWGNDENPDDYVEENVNRLIYLSYKPKEKPPAFLINSLTPGTSFDEKSHFGESTERIIIYKLLTNYQVFRERKKGLKWILKGGVKTLTQFSEYIRIFNKNPNNKLRNELFVKYRSALLEEEITQANYPKLYKDLHLNKKISLWEAVKRASEKINNSNKKKFSCQSEVVRSLRRILSRICLNYLGADIFILDEFQRYNNLIKFDQEAENPAIEMARSVFEIENAKVLMLSATPFKPYTNDFDELNGEVHHKEFESVLKFLLNNESEELWKLFKQNQKAFFSLLKEVERLKNNLNKAKKVKNQLELVYRKSMVRTERLLVSREHDAMIKSVLKDQPLSLSKKDISEYITIDKIIQYLNEKYNTKLPVPLEYVKSSPFILSYLDNYVHKRKLTKFAQYDKQLRVLINKTKDSWLPIKKIFNYESIGLNGSGILPNSKLRLLLEKTLYNTGWQYLWIPPTIEYYKPTGAYNNSKGYSKCIVFSSWQLVPRMISTIGSYEAERLSVGNPNSFSGREQKEKSRTYFASDISKRTPAPQIRFRVSSEKEPEQMKSFIILYPSIFLKDIFDPSNFVNYNLSVNEVREKIKGLIRKPLEDAVRKYGKGKSDWQKWLWVAPILLDKEFDNKKIVKNWFEKGIPDKELVTNADDDHSNNEENSNKQRHFNLAKDVFKNPRSYDLPQLESDQFEKLLEFIVYLSLGSPAICSFRSLHKYMKIIRKNRKIDDDLLDAAFNISSAFVTLFNKPESISIIRLTTKSEDFTDKILEYSIDGNIQSMLDEYLYLLVDCENLKSTSEISDYICDTLSIRTNTRKVDDLETYLENLNGREKRQHRIRTHFAVDFTEQKLKTATGTDRTINLRQAFNSPFRPFVLASTSIGQEGLDFHLYCKRIFHWNLLSNAIDLEQREGRIHRYKGLVIRQNLTEKYIGQVDQKDHITIWQQIFNIAAEEKHSVDPKCELVPYWHTESINGNKLERFVPLYPFSKNIEKYKDILKVLTYYRLTFGQPRQEELVDALYKGNLENNDLEYLNELIVNLSPMVFGKS